MIINPSQASPSFFPRKEAQQVRFSGAGKVLYEMGDATLDRFVLLFPKDDPGRRLRDVIIALANILKDISDKAHQPFAYSSRMIAAVTDDGLSLWTPEEVLDAGRTSSFKVPRSVVYIADTYPKSTYQLVDDVEAGTLYALHNPPHSDMPSLLLTGPHQEQWIRQTSNVDPSEELQLLEGLSPEEIERRGVQREYKLAEEIAYRENPFANK